MDSNSRPQGPLGHGSVAQVVEHRLCNAERRFSSNLWPSMKKIKGEKYWVLLCDDMICGVLSSKKEAQELAIEVKDCPVKHKIKECDVMVFIDKI